MTYSESIGCRTWTGLDVNASEYELGDFMYGLVRLLKPGMVVETGCQWGETSHRIGMALRDNDPTGHYGLLNTCDTDIGMVETTKEKCAQLPVNVFHQDALSMVRCGSWDLAFIDHSGDREEVLAEININPAGIVILHDSLRNYLVPATWTRIRIFTVRGTDIYQVP